MFIFKKSGNLHKQSITLALAKKKNNTELVEDEVKELGETITEVKQEPITTVDETVKPSRKNRSVKNVEEIITSDDNNENN